MLPRHAIHWHTISIFPGPCELIPPSMFPISNPWSLVPFPLEPPIPLTHISLRASLPALSATCWTFCILPAHPLVGGLRRLWHRTTFLGPCLEPSQTGINSGFSPMQSWSSPEVCQAPLLGQGGLVRILDNIYLDYRWRHFFLLSSFVKLYCFHQSLICEAIYTLPFSLFIIQSLCSS